MKVFTRICSPKFLSNLQQKVSSFKHLLPVSFLAIVMFSTLNSMGQVTLPHYEPMNYTAPGVLQTQAGWTAMNTGDDIVVAAGNLSSGSLPGSTGNKITFDGAGIDAAKSFTTQNTGTVYYSFLMNVSALGTLNTTGGYFTGLTDATTGFGATVWTRKDAVSGYDIGFAPRTTVPTTTWSSAQAVGTTVFVVVSYQLVSGLTNDVVKMWINPATGGTEPATTFTITNTGTDLTTVQRILVRQDAATTTPFIEMDEMRAGLTWASVTPAGAIPVVSGASLSGTVGTLFTNFQVVASNTPINTWAIASGTIAPGLGLNTGTGIISGTPTTAGSYSIGVNATNGAGTSASPGTISFTIAMGNQTITGLPATDTRTYTAALQQYNLTATGGGSGNAVTYSSDAPAVASVVGNQVTINGAGTAHITASQLGNANWNAATPVQQTLTVNQATQVITFGSLINRNDVDPNFQLTATSTSPNAIVYTSSNTAVATIVDNLGNLDPNGSYVDIVGPGTTLITASQAANANYSAATPVQQSQTIINTSLLPQTITFGPLSNKIYGDADFQLTATGGASGNPVTYISSDPSVATIVGVNGDFVHIVGPGTTTITASQAGNGSYNPAVPVPQNFTVDKKALTVTGATVDTKVYNATTAATISNASLNGVVGLDVVTIATFNGTFADPNVNNGIAVTAALTLGGADKVKYTLTQPTGLTGNITKASQTISFLALVNRSPGDPNFTLTATATSGLVVSYTSSDPTVATTNGPTGSLVHIVAVGATTITASQAGNQNYFAATAVPQTQTVVAAAPGSIFANVITDANPSAANPFIAGQTLNGNITVNGILRGTGITASSASNRFSASDWTLAASSDPNDYYEFTLTPNAGYKIDFTSLVFSHQRSAQGPATYALRSSQDNYATTISTGTTPTTAGTITIPLSSYININSSIKFRLYAYAAVATGGTYSVNDFIFNGNVTLAPPTATYVATNVSACGGTNDGTIIVTPSGTGPFSYSWTGITGSGNPATTPYPNPGNVSSLAGLPIGYYNVTVTDGNLNTTTITGIHIGFAYSVYVTNSGSISSACSNTGTIILYGNAGVQPYSFSLNGTTYQPGNTFTGLAAGPYTAYVKDAAGCISTKSITVTAAAPIVVSPFVRGASACGADGSIEVYRIGGIPPYTYSKDGTNYQAGYIFSGLAAGPYTVYVKDSKGCVSSQSATVTQGAALVVSASKTNTSLCIADGTIQLSVTGGVGPYTYSIDDGASYQPGSSFTGLSANTYPTKVKDSKGCTGSLNVTINLNPIVVTAFTVAASNCAASNGSIQLFRTGGVGPYTYSMDGNTYQPSNTFTGLTPNYYEGYVKDSKGCVGQLIDIYVGPDCGQRGVPLAKNADLNDNHAKVDAGNALKVQAYPNPTATEFTLQLDGFTTDKVSIIVTDIMGRKVYQAEGSGKQQFRFGNKLNAGLYNVQVIQGNTKKSIKLVKE